jgi:hypothetical protein
MQPTPTYLRQSLDGLGATGPRVRSFAEAMKSFKKSD